MKIRLDIDLPVPRWVRNAALVLTPVAVVLATTAVVRANVPNTFKDGDTLSAQKLNDNFSSLDGRITTLEASTGTPVGTVIAFGGATAPAGWLPCDGTQLDGTNAKFAALYAAIGTAYGGNTTSMQFNLPDLRGRFLRGWDHGAGHDPDAANRASAAMGGSIGDAVGTLQPDVFATHDHPLSDPGHTHNMSQAFQCGWGNWNYGGNNWDCQVTNSQVNYALSATTGISMQKSGGKETRPANVAVNYVIKL